ncbi:MAG: 3'-5' exonuclease [Bacteroidota bacterium]
MLPIKLDRDLVFFDIESTGLNVVTDRIIQIALIKLKKDGSEPEELEMLINPGVPIKAEAQAVHGISAKMVARKPLFKQVAERLMAFIGDADLAGYNSNRFDVPILQEEFHRAGIKFDISKRRLVDAQRIFYRMEPRTLRAALKYYTGQELTDAHDALADVRATVDVFKGQLAHYADTDYVDEDGNVTPRPLGQSIKEVAEFCADGRFLDATHRIKYGPDGTPVFAFGKYNGQPVGKTCAEDPNYMDWMLKKDFTVQVKELVKKLTKAYKDQEL